MGAIYSSTWHGIVSSYRIDESALEAFDSNFEKKEKCEADFQKEFQILLSLIYKAD